MSAIALAVWVGGILFVLYFFVVFYSSVKETSKHINELEAYNKSVKDWVKCKAVIMQKYYNTLYDYPDDEPEDDHLPDQADKKELHHQFEMQQINARWQNETFGKYGLTYSYMYKGEEFINRGITPIPTDPKHRNVFFKAIINTPVYVYVNPASPNISFITTCSDEQLSIYKTSKRLQDISLLTPAFVALAFFAVLIYFKEYLPLYLQNVLFAL